MCGFLQKMRNPLGSKHCLNKWAYQHAISMHYMRSNILLIFSMSCLPFAYFARLKVCALVSERGEHCISILFPTGNPMHARAFC